jgi:hypothetical protein
VGLRRGGPIKAKGKPRYKKSGVVDRDLREWIKTLPCVIGVKLGTFRHCSRGRDPHHVKSRGSSGPDHGNLVPLCRTHHDEHDYMGCESFPAFYGVDLKAIAQDLYSRYQQENAA